MTQEFDKEAEKRIRYMVYCADQLMTKRTNLWKTRYDRACSKASTIEELDEAILRINTKYPQLKLDQLVEEERSKTRAQEINHV